MLRRFLFLINPISGTRAKDGLKDYLQQKMQEANIPAEFAFTSLNLTPEAVREMALQKQVTDLVVCGGDGTVNLGAMAVSGTPIRLGIIPAGSGNGLARTAGISMKPGGALRAIIKGRSEKTDAYLINGRFSCMLSGLGLDAAVAHSFAQQKGRGLYNYTRQSVLEFIKAKPFPFTLKTDTLRIDSNAFFISIANSNQFGNNFTIAPKASLHDGLLDIVIVRKMWKVKMLYAITRQLTMGYNLHQDTNPESEEVIYLQTSSLTISNPSLALLHIDGDPVETSNLLNIKLIPGAFSLIVP